MKKQGLLFTLTGPSGAGKNTLIEKALKAVQGLTHMPTATTRQPRSQEEENLQRIFLSNDEFDQQIQEEAFFEWRIIYGQRYGILKSVVEQIPVSGHDYITDIDVMSALSLKKAYPDITTTIFVLVSSIDILKSRIKQRETISEEEVIRRLSRTAFEISFVPKCDYIVLNDNLDFAVEQLKSIILLERIRREAIILHTTFSSDEGVL